MHHAPLVGISGKKRSGKTTVANRLCEKYGYVEVAFADTLKEVALVVNPFVTPNIRLAEIVDEYGWFAAKHAWPEVRRTLQALGTGMRERLGARVFIDAVEDKIEALHRQGVTKIVVSDVRLVNEAIWTMGQGGYLLRIERPNASPYDPHPSETALDGYDFPHVIHNVGGMDTLFDDVDYFAEEILGLQPLW